MNKREILANTLGFDYQHYAALEGKIVWICEMGLPEGES